MRCRVVSIISAAFDPQQTSDVQCTGWRLQNGWHIRCPIRYFATGAPAGGKRMQVDQLKRREFIALLGGAAASWPLAARAQQRMRRVGALMGIAPSNREAQVWLLAFKRALQELGWIEGRNIVVDVRWPAGDVALMKGQAGPRSFSRTPRLPLPRCVKQRPICPMCSSP